MSVADAAFRREVGAAYATAASSWAAGAGFVYARLADALVARLPIVGHGLVLDLCAGTGAATAPLVRRGCAVIAVDLVPDMLLVDASERPPAVAADAFALPFRDRSLAAVVVACGLNHAPDPVAFLAESRRVTAQKAWCSRRRSLKDGTIRSRSRLTVRFSRSGSELPRGTTGSSRR